MKKEESESLKEENKNEEGQYNQLPQIISQTMNTPLSYPALHGAGGFFAPVFHTHTGPTILGVPSLCSFNSVTNFIAWMYLFNFHYFSIKDFKYHTVANEINNEG